MERECSAVPKKLVNNPKDCVSDALQGLALAHSRVKLLDGWNVVLRSDLQEFKKEKKVALISGGGSGHEPFAGGYVGKGFLTGCVAGDVFTSPSTASISQAVNNCYTPAGVLLIILNYTGDRLNFGKAVELAKSEGKNVDMVVVGEDCALISKDKSAGRRGLCGVIPIIKMAGAMTEENKSIDEIKLFLQEATSELFTISISLSACSIPGKPPGFTIPSDKFEFGLGIHGEAGVAQYKMDSASSISLRMINHIKSHHKPSMNGKEVAIVVNNLGGTSNLELSIMAKEVILCLSGESVSVQRCYVGSFMTSLEMAGVSLTIMLLNDDRIKYLDSFCDSSSWCESGTVNLLGDMIIPSIDLVETSVEYEEEAADVGLLHYYCTKEICEAFVANEEHLNELDRASGDGDTGTTFANCAEGLLAKFADQSHVKIAVNDPHEFLLALARDVEKTMGGSSGALVSLFFTAAASAVANGSERKDYIKSLELGISAIKKYGGAEEGDRTMLDAMCPALRALQSCPPETNNNYVLNLAAKAARNGANATVNMHAYAGRASYVSHEHLVSPDPGAVAVALGFEAIAEVFQKYK